MHSLLHLLCHIKAERRVKVTLELLGFAWEKGGDLSTFRIKHSMFRQTLAELTSSHVSAH